MGSDCDDLRGSVDCTTRKLAELNCDDPRDETTSRITLVDRNGPTVIETEYRSEKSFESPSERPFNFR